MTTWLLSIARFKALSARRRRTDAPLDETIETTVADSADDPEMVLQMKSRSELVRQALTNLSPNHREIIDLVYYHEKSIEDCALILGIPAGTVKTRMFYARKKLDELVQGALRGCVERTRFLRPLGGNTCGTDLATNGQ